MSIIFFNYCVKSTFYTWIVLISSTERGISKQQANQSGSLVYIVTVTEIYLFKDACTCCHTTKYESAIKLRVDENMYE